MTNCKETCRLAQYCYLKGFDDLDPENCANYYRIDDLLLDAQLDMEAERRREEPEDLDDWNE